MSPRSISAARRWTRLALLTAAILAILLLATGANVWHIDAPGSAATCPICHLAHLSPLLHAPAALVSAPVLLAHIRPVQWRLQNESPSALIPPPRAPPA
jgi:hypothetical protein